MDLSYKKMVLDKMGHTPDAQTMRTIEATDCFIEQARKAHPEKVEHFLMQLRGTLTGGHFDEETAEYAIEKMAPVGMKAKELEKMLPEAGKVQAAVRQSWEKAKMKGKQMGIDVPAIPSEYTAWDMYVVMAMFLADYWNLDGKDQLAPDFVYAYLSDPDAKSKSKIWDYLMK